MAHNDVDCLWAELSSPVGHDTFLVDMDMMADLIAPFLRQG
jgi:homoserine acetyltransferase